jgi:hypothetical protein
MKLLAYCCGVLGFALAGSAARGQVSTSQYDNFRTGATLNETILTPQNVHVNQFGKIGAYKVDGAVYAQPLFLPGVEIPGKGTHDVIFIATEHDSVYAFDAERPNESPLWQVSFLDKKRGTTPLPMREVACPFLRPEVGITSTPVIDRKTGTLYVLARTMVNPVFGKKEFFQHLHALAITTGVEKFGGPKLITASVVGHGEGATDGQVRFDPLRENPRASLVLANNVLYLTWASSCDVGPYHGWVMAYDPGTLAQKSVLNVTPDGKEGGIWASDTGPGVDTNGDIYVPTGNGTFDAYDGGRNYGDSVLRLGLHSGAIVIRDYFTPYDQAKLNDSDSDVGSSGPLLLPDQPGAHRHVLLQPTKGGTIYVLDRDRMGKFQRDGDVVLQKIPMRDGGYGAMAYWNKHVYFACSDDYLRDYVVESGKLRLNADSNTKFANPGATPTVSANGTKDAIVWAVATKTWDGPDRPAVLYAFDANKIEQPIYTSEQNSGRDRAATATRFVVPIVVKGRVYLAARGEVDVYGLLK